MISFFFFFFFCYSIVCSHYSQIFPSATVSYNSSFISFFIIIIIFLFLILDHQQQQLQLLLCHCSFAVISLGCCLFFLFPCLFPSSSWSLSFLLIYRIASLTMCKWEPSKQICLKQTPSNPRNNHPPKQSKPINVHRFYRQNRRKMMENGKNFPPLQVIDIN